MARHALLIGVSDFADKRLARLNAPTNDVIALRSILQDASRGGFDSVELSINDDFVAMRDHLSRFFHDRAPDDLLLLYYSGHGILGRGNRLFLATTGSDLNAPRDRSISAKEIREFIEDCRAERQIVVLDCCHSGAFAEHAKGVVSPPAVTGETFSSGDAGLYVLTAADALQFAWDGAELRAGNEGAARFSQFTSWLAEGLEKGEAAPDDEQITMDALYRYLFRRARSEGAAATPQRFVQGGVGELVISRNPFAGSSQIDPGIIAALAAEEFRMRLGAVAELSLLLGAKGSIAARGARQLLQQHFQRERDYAVRIAINKALGEDRPADTARQAQEDQRAEAARSAEEVRQRAAATRLMEEEEEKRRAVAARQAGTGQDHDSGALAMRAPGGEAVPLHTADTLGPGKQPGRGTSGRETLAASGLSARWRSTPWWAKVTFILFWPIGVAWLVTCRNEAMPRWMSFVIVIFWLIILIGSIGNIWSK